MKIKYYSGTKDGIGFKGTAPKIPIYSEIKLNTGAVSFKTFVLLISLLCLAFSIGNLVNFFANNGVVTDREYNNPAVVVENGDVSISADEFNAYRQMNFGSNLRFFSTIERLDTIAKGLNYESSSLSFDMWLAKNFPLLANWKDGTFDGEGFFGGIERFLNLIQSLIYTLCTGVFRFVYFVFYKFKFLVEIVELIWS